MEQANELRRRAESYRRMNRQISDPAAVQAILELAGEFEMFAAELEKRHRTRTRAHEIWVERGRPQGCDVECWLAAERELEDQHIPVGSGLRPRG